MTDIINLHIILYLNYYLYFIILLQDGQLARVGVGGGGWMLPRCVGVVVSAPDKERLPFPRTCVFDFISIFIDVLKLGGGVSSWARMR
jgi:hypothetical protein